MFAHKEKQGPRSRSLESGFQLDRSMLDDLIIVWRRGVGPGLFEIPFFFPFFVAASCSFAPRGITPLLGTPGHHPVLQEGQEILRRFGVFCNLTYGLGK